MNGGEGGEFGLGKMCMAVCACAWHLHALMCVYCLVLLDVHATRVQQCYPVFYLKLISADAQQLDILMDSCISWQTKNTEQDFKITMVVDEQFFRVDIHW
jgi:hypothetical protein